MTLKLWRAKKLINKLRRSQGCPAGWIGCRRRVAMASRTAYRLTSSPRLRLSHFGPAQASKLTGFWPSSPCRSAIRPADSRASILYFALA